MSTKTRTTDTLTGEIARLTSLVEEQRRLVDEQQARLEALEAQNADGANGNGNGDHRHSRRDLLRMAGLVAAGAAGAAGMSALQSVPAAAANGGNFILGQANNADGGTDLTPTTTSPSPTDQALLEIDGSTSPAGAVNVSATFFRAIRGVAPLTPSTALESGVGLWGSSDAGAGVVGSSNTGVDLWAFNSGRFLQTFPSAGMPGYQGGVFNSTSMQWTDFELVRDGNGVVWIYLPPATNGLSVAPNTSTFGGGTWIPLQPGGQGAPIPTGGVDSEGVLFTAVTTTLLGLSNSDGGTFQEMAPDATQGLTGSPPLVLSITPAFNCLAVLTINADLYTGTAGVNQDMGIWIDQANSTTFPQNIVAWKESGGTAANSPNAAFLETVFPMTRGVTYNVHGKWKANKSTTGTIRAGAGPFPLSAGLTHVSPSRLSAVLVISP